MRQLENSFKVMHVRQLERPLVIGVGLVTALILRTAVLFIPLAQASDGKWYYDRAVDIVQGRGFSVNGILTAFWPVGWPGFLAALFSVTGPSVFAGQIANLLMSIVVCVLTGVLGTRLFHNRSIGILAMLLIAIYPNQIAYVPLLFVEIFWAMLMLLCLLLLMREQVWSALIAGLLLGLAALTKTQTILLPAFLFCWLFLVNPRKPALVRYMRLLGVIYVAMIIVIAPWTYRNWTVFHALVPVSTNGGWTLLTGNNPEANGDYTPGTRLAEGLFKQVEDQVESDRIARERAVAWIKANPGKFVALLPRKFSRLWLLDGEAEWFYQSGYANYESQRVAFRAMRFINQGYYLLLMLLAVPAMIAVTYCRPHDLSLWAHTGVALSAFFTLLSLGFSGQSRFHFALMPLIAMFSAWSLLWLRCVWANAVTARRHPNLRAGS